MKDSLEFDWTQRQEMETAKEKGLDSSLLEDSRYLAQQMQEIRLGMEEGLDVSVYADPEFDWLQMEQIRLGLLEGADVSKYARKDYSFETMKQIRLAWQSFTDLMPYLEKGFEGHELEEIRLALEAELPIDRWLWDEIGAQQIFEIRTGLSLGLDVGIYAKSQYNWLQMQEIRKGMEERIEVSFYANPLLDHRQMMEIRYGLEAGIDVTGYARIIYTSQDMRRMRLLLFDEKEKEEETKTEENYFLIKESKKEINIIVEENGNKAYIYIEWHPGLVITKAELEEELKERQIVYGIKEDALERLTNKKSFNQKILVAEGMKPLNGENGRYEFFFRTQMPFIPEPLEDGSVDYANVEAFEMVKKDQEIARYYPATEGMVGKNVFGEKIAPVRGMEIPVLRGSGFQLAPDRVTYIARKKGKIEYENGKIDITNMILIREDVTSAYGKVEAEGSVHVLGSVHSGGYIQATGDIIIENNVEAARLIAGGRVLIKKGCCSKNECFISAGGEVSGSFFEAAVIKSNGNIKANYIMNSNIFTLKRVYVSGNKGTLMGGMTSAVQGVDTYNLGAAGLLRTTLDVGKNEYFYERISQLSKQKEKALKEIEVFIAGSKKLAQGKLLAAASAQEMLRKIKIGITMKQAEIEEAEENIKKLSALTEKEMSMPVLVRAKAYPESTVIIDGTKYVLPQEINRVIFKKKNRNIVMLRI